jgi:uncharacterized cupin superfamily protein
MVGFPLFRLLCDPDFDHTCRMDSTHNPRVKHVGTIDDPIPMEPTHDDPSAPVAGWVQVGSIEGAAVGIWEHSVGTSGDVEENEVFVVLSGRATVTPEGGEPVLFGPGDIGMLTGGTRTTWQVHETLRKVWIAVDDSDGHGDG